MMGDSKAQSAYPSGPANDTDFRKKWDLEEYAAKRRARQAAEREEAKARWEAKLAGKKYHKPMTGDETFTTARRHVMDISAQVGKTQLVPAGAGVGKRGRSAGFYCEACDLTFKDNKQFVEHLNKMQHLVNTGQRSEVRRATVEEVHERITHYVQRREELAKEKTTSLPGRLRIREAERLQEAEEKRLKRKAEAERRRLLKAEAKVKMEYGEDVRIEGKHEEEDMLVQMGFTGFGSSKV